MSEARIQRYQCGTPSEAIAQLEYATASLTPGNVLPRASVNWRTGVLYIRQKIWLKLRKLDVPAYDYAQNKMVRVHVRRKIISRRTV